QQLVRMPLAGGSPTQLTSTTTNGLTVDGTYLYWTDYDGGTIWRMPKTGGTPAALTSGQLAPTGIGVDATSVYWTTFGDGTLHRAPLGGGAPETLGTGSSYLLGL